MSARSALKALEPMITGPIHDCCCNADTVESINLQILPILDQLVETSFFRYYKVRFCQNNLLLYVTYVKLTDLGSMDLLFENTAELVARLFFLP
jgi:hypothetical protein